ncbi:uncharacterized protein L969DRAFT_50533 [Mixia osmundae IAM 14324]|uniref:SET domain-containing protein n=1 Tax=Mixia osmundae (strain CBS 9802 / IAM 14324 / JCM 22182 / KY 12970) TaxID=764103 RepID=G7E742_MIXOS|nr:uncharacterized protein L969DRAFT_50533 [Mixia osmundae IAM 14324]KEI38961.1 hypothetical protein L969DRAFT_50533 [Mixia osmundae IAM 14324]GAA98652.1 hypothetical protein E5Q_05340 [Mixia osmundae IAM 14324]
MQLIRQPLTKADDAITACIEPDDALAVSSLLQQAAQSSQKPLSPLASLEVRAVPGCGSGLFATVAYAPGDVLLREWPLIIAPDSLSTVEPFLRKAYDALSVRARLLVMSASRSRTGKDGLVQRFEDNAFSLQSLQSERLTKPYAAFYPRAARLNHSCKPCAAFCISSSTLEISIRAIKSIQTGEEVTISYLSHEKLLQPRFERREAIRAHRRFECICELCQSADAASDARLAQVARSLETIADWHTEELPPLDVIRLIGRVMDLLRTEAQAYGVPSLCIDAMDAAATVGDVALTKAWGSRAMASWSIWEGVDSPACQATQAILQDPASHELWNTYETVL